MTPDQHYRATQYPYSIPDYSFVFDQGETKPVRTKNEMPDLTGRTPVIACGSNLSHERLLQKYGEKAEPLPVIRIQLNDFDTVYAAHIARYGAVSATLHPSPGTTVSLAINWLSETQLTRMHETEADNYHYCKLGNLELTPEFGPSLTEAYAYIGTAGCWAPNEKPIPLAAVRADNRRWEAHHQESVQQLAHQRLAPDGTLRDFIHANIHDGQSRETHARMLQQTTQTFSYTFTEVLEMGVQPAE